MIARPGWIWAISVGGLGLLRPASGTWGSLPPAVLASTLLLFGAGTGWIALLMLALAAVASGICVAFGDRAVAHYGRPDPGQVVADEAAGQSIALLCLPLLDLSGTPWPWLIAPGACFVGFRIFDILKPPPADRLERLPAGWGILCDDLAAGAMAGVAVWLAALPAAWVL